MNHQQGRPYSVQESTRPWYASRRLVGRFYPLEEARQVLESRLKDTGSVRGDPELVPEESFPLGPVEKFDTKFSAVTEVTEYQESTDIRNVVVVSCVAGAVVVAALAALAMGGLLVRRRRKLGADGAAPSPPILVYPPQDVGPMQFVTKEINFSLPTLRSTSLGELREETVASGPAGSALTAPPSGHFRSNSFTNTSDLGVLDPSLYKPDCMDDELLFPEGHVGRVWFTLKYEPNTERLQVHVMKAKHLPSRTPASANACDPYVRIQLIPDERRVLQSKQKKKTCNPCFEETFIFQVPARTLEGLTLKLSVVDAGRGAGRGGHQLVGHVLVPLQDLVAMAPADEPQHYKMDLEKEIQEPTSDLGEVLVSLLYNENLHRLTVTIVEARRLKVEGGRREVCVRVTQARACRGVRGVRTAAAAVARDGSALLSECFHLRVRPAELLATSLTVYAVQPSSACAKDKIIGKFVLGSHMFARGKALQHWNSALASPMEQIQQWHALT